MCEYYMQQHKVQKIYFIYNLQRKSFKKLYSSFTSINICRTRLVYASTENK